MRKFLDALFVWSGKFAALFVLAIFVVMMATSIFRLVGWSTGGFEDVVGWLTAASAFLGLAHAFKHGEFVRVGLVLDALKPGPRRIAEVLSLSIAAAFTGYLAWSVGNYVYDSFQFGDMANGLIVIPIWIPQCSFVLGALMLFIAVIDELILVLGGRKPTYVLEVQARHARGDFSSDL